MKARNYLFVSLVIMFCGCANKGHKVIVDISSKQTRLNQPFSLIFTVSGVDLPESYFNQKIELPKSEDFIVVSNIHSFYGNWDSKKKRRNQVYGFVLIPKRAGDLIVLPWNIVVRNNETYSTDTIRIHVWNTRISESDSLREFMQAREEVNNISPLGKTLKGIHNGPIKVGGHLITSGFFSTSADSIYNESAGRPFEILYSFSFLNSHVTTEEKLREFTIGKLTCPPGLEKISERDTIIESGGMEYNLLTLKHIIMLKSNEKNEYTIPSVTFDGNGRPYTYPPIKIYIK